MLGQRIMPQRYHPLVEQLSDTQLRELVGNVRKVIATCVEAMPRHEQFIARYCAAVT
jgi:tryptophan 7-halogenase